jgi:hypothetical protein
MNLYKKLSIALLCFSMAYPVCMAMDQDQETGEIKDLSGHRKNAVLALRVIHLHNSLPINQNASACLEQTKRLLTVEAGRGHKPSRNCNYSTRPKIEV